jgi:hypothetical protein
MLFPTAQETPRELANEVSRAAAAMASTTTLLVSHKRVHRKALYALCQPACPIDAQVCRVSHTPSPPALSPVGPSPMPLVPSPAPSGPDVPGTLYGFVDCAGVLWLEEPPTGASLVGSSHCETPVLIWT